jgi:hypothetical protein
MKKQVATLLLVCYAAFLLRPLLPVLEDVMAHMLWKNEHIATVHYENGKYHVHLEISDAEEKSANTSKSLIKQIEPLTFHLTTDKGFFGLALNLSVRLVDYARCTSPRDGLFLLPDPPPWVS